MTCYHPLKAWPVGTTATGKPDYLITSNKIDWIYFSHLWHRWQKGAGKAPDGAITEYIHVPCGQCIGCRLDYSRQWANRCMLESQYHAHTWFLTLTYDDEHIHQNDYLIEDTGEAGTSYTLFPEDLTLFWKRLRKNTGQKFRYYACGEYGDNTARPHYHAIVFGLDIPDLKIYKKTALGFNLYTSDTISKTWKNGYAIISESSWETCAYTARYVMKKRKGITADFYRQYNMVPEFVRMSRRPGIGLEYYNEHRDDIYETDELIFSTKKGGMKTRPPRYFDKLYEQECPELFQNLKQQRVSYAEKLQKLKVENSDLDYYSLLEKEEEAKENQTKSLKRLDI